MEPTIGRIVHYKLNATDIAAIDTEVERSGGWSNSPNVGQVVAATIVQVWPSEERLCNLRLHVDGNVVDPWVTSRAQGSDPGQWDWPPRV